MTFGAYLVEASSPIAGLVYDGTPSEDQKDQDYQNDVTTLRAFWEGFHDPHSALTSYYWRIGSCNGCDDVIKEHYLGTVTSKLFLFQLKNIAVCTFLIMRLHEAAG